MITISFKIDDALHEELKRLGKEHNGISPSLIARKIVEDFLGDSEHHAIRKDIAELRRQSHYIHHDLVTVAYVLLLKAKKVETKEEAKAWVQKHLFGPTFDEMRD